MVKEIRGAVFGYLVPLVVGAVTLFLVKVYYALSAPPVLYAAVGGVCGLIVYRELVPWLTRTTPRNVGHRVEKWLHDYGLEVTVLPKPEERGGVFALRSTTHAGPKPALVLIT